MKNTLLVLIILTGSLGFTYGQSVGSKMKLIRFPNGDESITIVEKGNNQVLRLVSKNDKDLFLSLELSNHEIGHRDLPVGNLQDSLKVNRTAISQREDKSKKRGNDSRDPNDEDKG